MKITAGEITQYQDIDAGLTLQNVPWSISDDETVLLEGSQSFPLNASTEDITEFLSRRLQVFKDDAARHAEASVLQEQLDNATSVAGEVSNLEITD